MAKFNLADVISGKVSKLDTPETAEIALDLIEPNEKNFFTVEDDITDLCESIKLNGLLQPPVVTPAENGRYRLIAGHRRHKALTTLWAEDPEKYKTVMCQVVHPASPELEELMLIQTNTEARELGWSEKNKAAARAETLLIELHKQGMELPGKLRTHVAKLIKTSESQIARAKFIAKNLIKPLQRDSGISDSAAYKLAHLPKEQQQELYEHYKTNLYCLTASQIANYQKKLEDGRAPFWTPPPAPRSCYEQKTKGGEYKKCDHVDVIADRKKKKIPSWQKCGSRDCCSYCAYRYDCEDVCPALAKSLDTSRKTESFRVCSALREARKRKGLSEDDAVKLLGISHDQLLQYETNFNHTAASVKKLCQLYDTTPNEVLGFDSASPAPATPAPASWIPADQATDLPDGYYTLLYEYEQRIEGQDGLPLLNHRTVLRQDGRWFSLLGKQPLRLSSQEEKLVAVAPAFSAPEGYTFFLAGVDEPAVDDLADYIASEGDLDE